MPASNLRLILCSLLWKLRHHSEEFIAVLIVVQDAQHIFLQLGVQRLLVIEVLQGVCEQLYMVADG